MYIAAMFMGAGLSLLVARGVGQLHVFWKLTATAVVFFPVYYGFLLLEREPLLTRQGVITQKIKKYIGN